jgi:CRP-like cAMP-binding protein
MSADSLERAPSVNPPVGLENCGLFQGLPPELLRRIKEMASEREFPASTTIFSEGEPAAELLILRSGKVQLDYTLPNDPSIKLPITDIRPGDVFAWSALANKRRFTARARTVVDSGIHAIPAAPLREMLAGRPEVGYVVMQRLAALIASRLHETRLQLRWLQPGA